MGSGFYDASGHADVIARISSMNWGLESYYDIILREVTLGNLLPNIGLLMLFYLVTILISIVDDKQKRGN